MELTAKLVQILDPVTGQGKNGEWKKQNFIFETEGQYPKKVCITTWGDKIDTSSLQLGDSVTVGFDLDSREYNGNWYTDVRAWKMVKASSAGAATESSSANVSGPAPVSFDQDGDDDLPF